MRKFIPIKYTKIWGYEIWLHSTLAGHETYDQFGYVAESGPLIKIIFAKEPLSVQVHPSKDNAIQLEGYECAKDETWYVLEAIPMSKIIYGLQNNIINRQTNNLDLISWQTLTDMKIKSIFNILPVEKGDFIKVDAGVVHGLGVPHGAEIKVIEVQKPSDVTYRIYDYNRIDEVTRKPRKLDIDKSKVAINKSLNKISNKDGKVINHGKFSGFECPFWKQYSLQNCKAWDKAWVDGYVVSQENNEYYAYEITKGETFPVGSISFIDYTKK